MRRLPAPALRYEAIRSVQHLARPSRLSKHGVNRQACQGTLLPMHPVGIDTTLRVERQHEIHPADNVTVRPLTSTINSATRTR